MNFSQGPSAVRVLIGTAALAVALFTGTAVAAAPVIENGGFETGSLKGWKKMTTDNGYWRVYSGKAVNLPPLPPPPPKRRLAPQTYPVHAPPRGKFALASVESDPSTTILYQDFTVPKHAKLKLIAYYKSEAPMTTRPDLSAESDMSDNQQYRIDLMKPNADLRSVDPADVLKTVFQTQTGDPAKLKPTQLQVGLGSLAGRKIRLRVAQTDNENILVASVDGVKVKTSK
jgi:hypothetical protein